LIFAKVAIESRKISERSLLNEDPTASLSLDAAALKPVLALAMMRPQTKIERVLENALISRSPEVEAESERGLEDLRRLGELLGL
jgi:hypothetical protein